MLGELVGFVAPALAGVLLTRFAGGLGQPGAPLITLVLLVVAGSIEGAALGVAQGRVLQHVLPALPWRRWALATALGAGLAWLLGMLPNTVGELFGWDAGPIIGAWIVVAPGVALSLGAAQWLVLRRHLPRAAPWVPVTAFAWALGVIATFVGASFIGETTPIAVAVAISVASAVVMGLVAGALSGWGLLFLLRRTHRSW